jgi:hypothetical protein
LNSILGEANFTNPENALWTRVEILQRTPAELAIQADRENRGRWVSAITLGYTRKIVSVSALDFWVGGSATLTAVPDIFAEAYGDNVIFSGKLYLQARLVRHFSFGQ